MSARVLSRAPKEVTDALHAFLSSRANLADTLGLLREIEQQYSPAALSNGFGPESMVLTDLIARHDLAIDIFSLDTGRLPPETYHLAQATVSATD